jgi:hypothetical protein
LDFYEGIWRELASVTCLLDRLIMGNVKYLASSALKKHIRTTSIIIQAVDKNAALNGNRAFKLCDSHSQSLL